MPKYVVFKGDNDLYLSGRVIQKYNYPQYAASDIADPTAVNTIFPEHVGGIVRIKSNHFGRFWRGSPNWIWADSTDTTGRNQDTRFRVVQVSDYFALQNLGNHKYCIRLTADGKTSCLKAEVSTITLEARIQVEEAVLERQIDNVSFRLSEARIYGETPLYIPNVTSTNRTNQPNNKTLSMEYKVTDTRSFTSTVGLKIGVEVKFRAGIPIIADGQVLMSTEVSTEQAWGKTTEETKTLEAKYEAIVPSMSRVVLRAAATQGFVDVPFSYRQRDVLTTGQVVVNTLHDGLFTGVNSYNFHYETTEERL